MITLRVTLILFLFILAGCSEKKSILSEKVEKDPGALTVLNESGFIGATVAGTSIEYILRLKSSGGLSVRDMSVTLTTSDPISFKGGSYPGTSGTCGTELGSGETCTMVFLYEPIDTNGHIAELNFSYRDVLSSKSFNYTLSADSHPILSFEFGTTYDFGNKFIGSSTDLKIKISNTGKVAAENITINNLGAPFSYKGGSYPGTGGDCGNRITPGEYCEIIVNYSPVSNGEHLQDITLNYTNTGRPETNTLRMLAWGFYQAILSVSDSPGYDFGTVATNHTFEKTFTISHLSGDVSATGLKVLGLSAPFGFKGGSFPGIGGTCTSTLSKETASCTIVVTLNSSSSGSWSNSLNFSYHNGSSTVLIPRSLTGITKLRPVLSFSDTGINDFGTVQTGSSSQKTFTVTYVSGELPATSLAFSNLAAPFNYTGGTFPGTGGTCPSTLTSGSCTIKVSFSPTTNGASNYGTYLRYHNGVTTISSAFISLRGMTEAKITAVGSVPYGNVVVGQWKDNAVALNFQGGVPATSLGVDSITGPFAFRGGNYPGSSGTCSTTLSSGTCYLWVRFSPLADGAQNGILTLKYHDGFATRYIPINLSGTGTPAALLSLPDSDFGTGSINEQIEKIITMRNDSSKEAISISLASMPSGFTFKGGSYPGTGGTCSSYLGAGSNCRIVVVMKPSSAGALGGNLSFTYNDGATTKTVTAVLSGTGVTSSQLFLSQFDTITLPDTYIGQTRDVALTLSHGGSSTPAVISSKTFSTGSEFSVINDTCPGSLVSGASCSLTIRFTPVSGGNKNTGFSVNYSDGSAKQVTRLLSARALVPALLSITPSPFSFGARPTDASHDQVFTINHSGGTGATSMTGLLSGSSFSFKGGSYPGAGGTCLSSLSSGGSCTIVGRFSPTTPGNYSGDIGVRYYNGYQYVELRNSLSGEGSPTAVLLFAASIYDFGDIIQTQSASRTITVNHSGPVPATAISAIALSPPYSFKDGAFPGTGGTCSETLSSGTCTIVIDFNPTTTGVKNQNLQLSYHNGSTARTINTSLTGKSLAQAILSISESNPFHMGTTNVNGTIDKEFSISNSGDIPGTSLGGSFEQAVFTFKGGTFPGTGGSCGTTLDGGSSCTIVVSFRPTQSISYSSIFTLSYEDGLRSQTEFKTLTGTGSNTLNKAQYLSFLDEELNTDHIEVEELSGNIFRVTDYHNNQTLSFKSLLDRPAHLGTNAIPINNRSHLLFPVYIEDDQLQSLMGYEIRSLKDGNLLERFLPEPSRPQRPKN